MTRRTALKALLGIPAVALACVPEVSGPQWTRDHDGRILGVDWMLHGRRFSEEQVNGSLAFVYYDGRAPQGSLYAYPKCQLLRYRPPAPESD